MFLFDRYLYLKGFSAAHPPPRKVWFDVKAGEHPVGNCSAELLRPEFTVCIIVLLLILVFVFVLLLILIFVFLLVLIFVFHASTPRGAAARNSSDPGTNSAFLRIFHRNSHNPAPFRPYCNVRFLLFVVDCFCASFRV